MGTMGGSGRKAVAVTKKASPDSPRELTPLRSAVVELYGRGFKRAAVAKSLLKHLVKENGPSDTYERRYKQANMKLRRWEQEQWFRDELAKTAIIDTDIATKDIMKAVVAEAKRGKVDAAKFALEFSGRYTPKGDATPPQVSVVFTNLPRPMRELAPRVDVEQEGEEVE